MQAHVPVLDSDENDQESKNVHVAPVSVVAVGKGENMQEDRTLKDDQDGARHERRSKLVLQRVGHRKRDQDQE
jgi:hypothetical protein